METKGASKGLRNPPYWEYSCETLAGFLAFGFLQTILSTKQDDLDV